MDASAHRVAARWLRARQVFRPLPWEMTRREYVAPAYPKGKSGWEVLYHGTTMAALASIQRSGLDASRGSGLWASVVEGGDRGEVLIQFQIPPGAAVANRSFAGGLGHVEVKQNVPAKDILSVHGPWPLPDDVEDGILSGPPLVRSDLIRNRPDVSVWHGDYVRAALAGGFEVPARVRRDYGF